MKIESRMNIRLLIAVAGALLLGEGLGFASDPEPVAADQYTPGEKSMHEQYAGEAPVYRLWPGDGRRADDALKDQQEVYNGRVEKVACPSVTVMRPAKQNGVALLVFPGGGYNHLAAGKEGMDVGKWLNEMGITAFIVKYRVPRRADLIPPLQDAQRALRWVRANATFFGVNPNQVGVMGFSAGGHLSASCVHQYDAVTYEPFDATDKLSCKPDFAVLIYPAYLSEAGKIEVPFDQVKDPKIPIFIAISKNDGFVEGVNAYEPVLKGAGVNHEIHLYDEGGHGTGMQGFPWPKDAEKWLRQMVE